MAKKDEEIVVGLGVDRCTRSAKKYDGCGAPRRHRCVSRLFSRIFRVDMHIVNENS